jgi:hypothetical protein
MLRYWLLVFSLESKLENKLVVSLSCRLGIARDTKVPIKKKVSTYLSLRSAKKKKVVLLHFVSGPMLSYPSSLTWNYGSCRQATWLFGRVIALSRSRHVCMTAQMQKKRGQTSVPRVGCEPTVPVFELAKTFRAFYRALTVIDQRNFLNRNSSEFLCGRLA